MANRGLGRGLGALIAEADSGKEPVDIPVAQIEPNPFQPRRHFEEEALNELAQSISEHGLLQPIVVRTFLGQHQLVAGERRLRASKIAGLESIPVIIMELTDRQVAEIALIENLQREDLTPIEEAVAYKRLLEEFGLTQEALAQRLGKSRPAIANTLRLLNLDPGVQEYLAQGKITAGHARTLLALPAAEQIAAAQEIVNSGMTVRAAEDKQKPVARKKPPIPVNPNLIAVQEQLMERLGTKVVVEQAGEGGRIIISFYSAKDANRVLEKILT